MSSGVLPPSCPNGSGQRWRSAAAPARSSSSLSATPPEAREYFARGAVLPAGQAGASWIPSVSEANAMIWKSCRRRQTSSCGSPRDYQEILRRHLRQGTPFPAGKDRKLSQKYTGDGRAARILREPNNILGIEYLKAPEKDRKLYETVHDFCAAGQVIMTENLQENSVPPLPSAPFLLTPAPPCARNRWPVRLTTHLFSRILDDLEKPGAFRLPLRCSEIITESSIPYTRTISLFS